MMPSILRRRRTRLSHAATNQPARPPVGQPASFAWRGFVPTTGCGLSPVPPLIAPLCSTTFPVHCACAPQFCFSHLVRMRRQERCCTAPSGARSGFDSIEVLPFSAPRLCAPSWPGCSASQAPVQLPCYPVKLQSNTPHFVCWPLGQQCGRQGRTSLVFRVATSGELNKPYSNSLALPPAGCWPRLAGQVGVYARAKRSSSTAAPRLAPWQAVTGAGQGPGRQQAGIRGAEGSQRECGQVGLGVQYRRRVQLRAAPAVNDGSTGGVVPQN